MKYAQLSVLIPDRPDIIKIIIVPAGKILINKAAAPDAKIIRLVQRLDECADFTIKRYSGRL